MWTVEPKFTAARTSKQACHKQDGFDLGSHHLHSELVRKWWGEVPPCRCVHVGGLDQGLKIARAFSSRSTCCPSRLFDVAIARLRSPVWHRLLRRKRSRARRFLRRKKLRNRLTTKEKDKLKVRQQLLEKHHTRPRYVIPLLSAMTWKNKGQNSGRWSNWSGDWKTTDKSDKKKKEEPQGKGKANAGQVTILAYDGRRVVVPEEGGGNGGSSSASSSGLQEENRRLKEAFRSILGGTADDTTEEEVRGLLADDPREVLRQQQKELNKQKKALTKTEKVRAAMEEKSAKWTRWKAGYLKGLELEEQRYKEEMKELEAELKEVEKEKEKEKGGIMDLDAPESHEDGYKKSVDNELNTFRQQMKQMSSYVQMMEQRNQDLTNQMQQLITAVRDVKQGDLVRESPQAIKAPVHVRLDGEDAEVEEPEAREARSRSRSRTPGRALESELPSHLAPEAAGFLPLLQGMTEETQDQMLAILKAEPENFQNSEQVKKLIHVMTVQQCAAQVEVQEGSADSSDPIFQMGTGRFDVLKPFGVPRERKAMKRGALPLPGPARTVTPKNGTERAKELNGMS